MPRMAVRVPQDLLERVDAEAEALNLNRSNYVRMILTQNLPQEGED